MALIVLQTDDALIALLYLIPHNGEISVMEAIAQVELRRNHPLSRQINVAPFLLSFHCGSCGNDAASELMPEVGTGKVYSLRDKLTAFMQDAVFPALLVPPVRTMYVRDMGKLRFYHYIAGLVEQSRLLACGESDMPMAAG